MIDAAILQFDRALRTVFATAASQRPVPGDDLPEPALTEEERKHAAALMRINHVGEICAQALYQGQSLMSRQPEVTAALRRAADEETEHLAWTEQRIRELGGHKSLLNPLWYGGALAIGVLAGKFGEAWNLGFLAETERQVGAHLQSHLAQLPEGDARSRAIVTQMMLDEAEHADTAVSLGGVPLPGAVCHAMRGASRIMTSTAYWV
ncbi:MAG: demethoxyubiquinone hydroxylase family protein [Proteobacteria bacterium]|nr:MAG: demethoxyubiquinone hydroxylase family protein [Pseudomonadota bacterium]